MLLNEMEILLAQTRLMELYLKQSQATAANESARIHEQYQAELVVLRSALADKEHALAKGLSAGGEIEKNLRDQIRSLENRLGENQSLLESRDAELQSANATTAGLHQRIADLENAHRRAQAINQEAAMSRQGLQAELLALRHQLEKSQNDFQSQQLISRGLQENLETQLAQLHDQLTEKQAQSQTIASELEQAKYETASLRRQLSELQASSDESQRIATQELEQARARFELELTGLQAALATRDRNLLDSENAFAEIERSLKTEIIALRSQLEQRQELIEFRDDELRDTHGQLAALQQRVVELESIHDSIVANAEEIDLIRRSFESEITALQQEVAFKERALSQRQEANAVVELSFHSKIQALQEELARGRSAMEQREHELQNARTDGASLRQQLGQLASAAATADLSARQLAEEKHRSVELETELARLHSILAQKDYALKEQENFSRSNQERVGGEINQLRIELEQQQTDAESTGAELVRLRLEIAALHEQSIQSELARRQLEENWQHAGVQCEELESRLRAKENERRVEQEQREAALMEQASQFRSVEDRLSAEIKSQHAQLEARQTLWDQGHTELERLRSEIADLRERNSQSELSYRQLEEDRQRTVASQQELTASLRAKEHELSIAHATADELKSQIDTATGELQLLAEEKHRSVEQETELARLHANLAQKEYALKEQENSSLSAKERLGGEINQLRDELAQRQTDAESTGAELAQLRAEIAALNEQSIQSELARRQLKENWQHAGMQREELESRLRAKDDEIRAAQERREAALREQENQFSSAEDRLSAEIKALRAQLEERQTRWDQGQAELARLRSEIADLRERNSQSELSHRQIEEDRQRTVASQQELTARLRAKEHELSIAHATANELKSQFDAATGELQLQLAERGLLAQSRVMEIGNLKTDVQRLSEQLAQRESVASQATADFHRETESSHAAHQAELAALQDEHRAKQQSLENERVQEKQSVSELRNRIEDVERRAGEAETALKTRDHDFLAATSEAAALRARVHELETLSQGETAATQHEKDQARIQSETALDALRNDLQQKAWALAQQQATVENLALAQRNQIEKLEAKLAEQQNSIKDRNLDIESALSQTHSLQRRIEELETELQHAQVSGLAQAEQLRQQSVTQFDELNKQLAQKAAEIQDNAMSQSTLEQSLRSEIDRLIHEAQERNQILQDRNDEVVRVKADMDLLLDRFTQLESSASQSEATLMVDTEQMRTEFQAQLALLQAELSQKEWALEEQRAAASGMDQQYREQVEALRQQLAQTESRAQEEKDKFILGEDKLTGEQQERHKKYREVMDIVAAGEYQSFPASENRRWRTRIGWKRRWKS